MKAIQLLRLLTLCVAAYSLPAVGADAPKCKLARIAEWPIRIPNHHPILEGTVNGKKIGVTLDTGAHASLLMKSAAERLDLPTRRTNEHVTGPGGGSSRVYVATIDELRLGEATRKNWRVPVVGERPMSGIDFILGDDFLRQVDLEFDYANSVVRVFKPENCGKAFLAYWDAHAHQVPMESEDRVFMSILVNGRRARAMLDSGSFASVVSLAFAEELGITKDSPEVVSAGCAGGLGGGVQRVWMAKFDSVTIGDEIIRDPRIRVQDYTIDMANVRLFPPDILLGTDFLKAHRVLVSRSQGKVYFSHVGGQVFPAVPTLECDERVAAVDSKAAEALLDVAIKANPSDTKALLQRANLKRRGKDLTGALADLDAVLLLNASDPVALTMRANVRATLADFDGALVDTDAALASGVHTAQLHASRGAIFRAKNDCARAVREYEEALRLDPQHQGAQRGLASCRQGEVPRS